MDGLAVVTESLLREAFRVASFSRPLCPCVTVGMQGHTLDAQAVALLLEFSGTVARADGCRYGNSEPSGARRKRWKQW